MKLPIDEDTKSPLQNQIHWFEGKGFEELLEEQSVKFKLELKQNTLAIVNKLNKTLHDKIDGWCYLRPFRHLFGALLKAAIRIALSNSSEFDLTIADRYQLLTFFNYTFNSIEVDFVHDQVRRYLPLSIWFNLSETRRNIELGKLSKRIQIAWKKLEDQDQKLNPITKKEKTFERTFVFNYMKQFLRILKGSVVELSDNEGDESTDEKLELDRDIALYCQRFLEFIIDLESQLPLRRFFHALLDSIHLIVRCQLSTLARHTSPEGHLFSQLIELLLLYTRYDLDLMTGDPLTDVEILRKHEEQIVDLQQTLWKNHPHIKKYAIKPIRAIDNPSALYRIVTSFDSKEELFEFLLSIGLVDEQGMDEDDREDAPLMASILMNHYRRYESQLKKINSIPLFPNESVIWDTNLVPDQYYNYECPLALPKLNLQFLTMSDYLLRNFMLFKNESTYEIRQDLEDGINRSKCRWTDDGHFATGPKQRMALIIKDFSLVEVGKPKLGEQSPSKVRAKVVINMDYVKPEWRREWEQLKKHDTCFLISFRKSTEEDKLGWPESTYPKKNLVKYVRGCEIEGLLDSEGKMVDENSESPKFTDNIRTFMLCLDCNQYKMDQDNLMDKKATVYDKFHLIVRRKPEKNNFKGVLETIRGLINTKFVVPDWLRNLLIGFGDPSDAHYSNLRESGQVATLDYFDTFVDYRHLKETFSSIRPNYAILNDSEMEEKAAKPPFRITMDDDTKRISIVPYKIPSRGPYPQTIPKTNSMRFTPAQAEAITSGLQVGLTMIVGPPGAGKTDVAVQILNTLYHSNPDQRTLIVTHSNQALNQIFDKMVELDVKEHHLLRLGHGEEDLESAKDFSRQGRVKYVLSRRLELLIMVGKLARSLDLDAGRGFTCETAEYFHFYHIIPRWDEYIESIRGTDNVTDIGERFPFSRFFDDAPQPLFKQQTISEDFEIAKACYRYIEDIFDDLQSFRPFEIFHTAADRSKYLLIREAKVIAMTCTHAGLRRKELVEMNFHYDNILMEETAQILEIETTIPLLLQSPENGVSRLKRWIMIGDHNQLPPIIQNSAFQKFSNMEQSLFARFVRLGVPAIELDAQGRARASLCDLYRWRYKNLRDLPHIHTDDKFKRANAGFVFDYQMVNVNDYNGFGETAPMAYYYQNRGEAEFVVALFKYMRILGYPAETITILTTYNGQKQLIRELVERECTKDGFIGRPSKVTTVDKFQGQQNDYILLSLVRTKTVGHLRDVRRLVVAMSRARLGLYVFGRLGLFSNCFELQHPMRLFLSRPQSLCLVSSQENFPTNRSILSQLDVGSEEVRSVSTVEEMQQLVERRYSVFIEEKTRLARQLDERGIAMDDEDDGGS